MRPPPPRALRRAAAAAALGALVVGAGPAAAYPGLSVVYAPRAGAAAIHDGTAGLPGLRGAVRQAPIARDWRWPSGRQVAKVAGRELSRRGARGMAATLRRALGDGRFGGLVAIDEVSSGDWSAGRLGALAAALGRLGPEARKVIVYVSPGLVAQVGRRDPRLALGTRLGALLAALRRAGAVILPAYRAGAQPMRPQELADYPTRWLARWTAAGADPGRLHLMLGPSRGLGQARLWTWARQTPAGRTILANGACAYGIATHAEGLDWLRQLRAFEANPTAPPAVGDRYVPTAGALRVTRPASGRVVLSLARPGRAVMWLQPLFSAPRRVVAKLRGPGRRVVRIPRDLRPGRYRIITVALGGGIREVSNLGPLVVPRR